MNTARTSIVKATVALTLTAALGACGVASSSNSSTSSTAASGGSPQGQVVAVDTVGRAPERGMPQGGSELREFPGGGVRIETAGDLESVPGLDPALRTTLRTELADVAACGPRTVTLTAYRTDGWASVRYDSTECKASTELLQRSGAGYVTVERDGVPVQRTVA